MTQHRVRVYIVPLWKKEGHRMGRRVLLYPHVANLAFRYPAFLESCTIIRGSGKDNGDHGGGGSGGKQQ